MSKPHYTQTRAGRETALANLDRGNQILRRRVDEQRTARREKIARLVSEGRTNEEISAIVGFNISTITSDRRALGISGQRGSPWRFTPDEERLAVNLLTDGCPYKEVARTLRCNVNAVRRRWPGYGIGPGNPLGQRLSKIAEQLGLGAAV